MFSFFLVFIGTSSKLKLTIFPCHKVNSYCSNICYISKMNAQVNRGNTHSSADSRKRYIRFERYSRAHWRWKNSQFVLGCYSGHQTSIIGRYVFSGVRVTRSLVYMHVLSIIVCPFVLFLLAIMLSVLLLYTVSNCPFGILKLFFHNRLLVIRT